MSRIIDKDVDTYTAFMETHQSALRRCFPCEETRNQALLDGARAVVDALRAYRAVIDTVIGEGAQ